MSNAKWVVYKDTKGEYRFRLIANNGEIVCVGEGYVTREGAYEGIDTVKAYAAANIPTRDDTNQDQEKTRIAGALDNEPKE